MQQLKQR